MGRLLEWGERRQFFGIGCGAQKSLFVVIFLLLLKNVLDFSFEILLVFGSAFRPILPMEPRFQALAEIY